MNHFSLQRFFLVFSLAIFAGMYGCSSPTSPSGGGGTSSGGALVVPTVIDFGTLSNGQPKDTIISIFDESIDTVTITSESSSSSAVLDTNFSHAVIITPNHYRTVHIEFTPSSQVSSATDSLHYQAGGKTYVAIMTLQANGGGGTTGGSGSLYAPPIVNFGMLPVGTWHDTTIVLVNTGTAPLTIVSHSMSSLEALDTNFSLPVTINGGNYLIIHLQFNPNQSGIQTAVDSLHYISGTTSQYAVITLTATGAASSNTPGPGSYFTYDYSAVDTNGITGPHSDSTYTVVTNTLTFAGKTNVVEVQSGDGSLSYYHLEQNGDLSVYVDLSAVPIPIGISATWFTIPIGSKTPQSTTLFDSTIMYPLNGTTIPVAVSITSTAKDIGPATLTAAGHTFNCEKGSLAVAFTASAYGGFATLASSVQTTTVWYSKQLKYYPERQDQTVNSGLAIGNTTTSDTYLLKSYSEK